MTILLVSCLFRCERRGEYHNMSLPREPNQMQYIQFLNKSSLADIGTHSTMISLLSVIILYSIEILVSLHLSHTKRVPSPHT